MSHPIKITALKSARQIITWARGKPEPIRNLAAMLCAQLRVMAKCPHSGAVRVIVNASAIEATR